MITKYTARSKDVDLISRINSELSGDGSSGVPLESYKAHGKLFGLYDLFGPQPSWSAYHLHTPEPIEYQGLSISLASKPVKRWGFFGPISGMEVTMDVDGEDAETKMSPILEKYNFRKD